MYRVYHFCFLLTQWIIYSWLQYDKCCWNVFSVLSEQQVIFRLMEGTGQEAQDDMKKIEMSRSSRQ